MSGTHLFISYSHKDEQYVRGLARRLIDAGIEPWYFTESQVPGISWPQRLLDAIGQARAVLVVISQASNSPEAEYVLSEVLLAQRERRFIIPLKIHPGRGPLDIMLAARNRINAWDGSDPLPRILAAIATQADAGPLGPATDVAQLSVAPQFREYANHATLDLALPAIPALLDSVAPVTLCRLGRDPRGDLVFAKALAFVSRQHARVSARSAPEGWAFILSDEGSSHGTFVNSSRIAEPHILLDGDQIGLGIPSPMLVFERLAVTGDP
ncbi:MAG: TIR domain-containing protein [Chloroflexales bacterium]|nr:TIR domain-containing protein [Chloroflexales bacterium]